MARTVRVSPMNIGGTGHYRPTLRWSNELRGVRKRWNLGLTEKPHIRSKTDTMIYDQHTLCYTRANNKIRYVLDFKFTGFFTTVHAVFL